MALVAGMVSPSHGDVIIISGNGGVNTNVGVTRTVGFLNVATAGDTDSASHALATTTSVTTTSTASLGPSGNPTNATATATAGQTVAATQFFNPGILETSATTTASYNAPQGTFLGLPLDSGAANANAFDLLQFTLTSPTYVEFDFTQAASTNSISGSALVGPGILFGSGSAGFQALLGGLFAGTLNNIPSGVFLLPAGDYALGSVSSSTVAGFTGGSANGSSSLQIEVVPEPSTLILFGAAAAGAGVYWRRRRAVAA